MQNLPPSYDPNNPQDVSDYLGLLFDLYTKHMTDQASSSVLLLAATEKGRLLLHNAHRVVSAQLGKSADPAIFNAQLFIQKLTGMYGRPSD
jgi:hypothetical protein